jgi:hypothetical protein
MTREVPGADVAWVPGKGWDVDFLSIGIGEAAHI